jgi:hypothetical protein
VRIHADGYLRSHFLRLSAILNASVRAFGSTTAKKVANATGIHQPEKGMSAKSGRLAIAMPAKAPADAPPSDMPTKRRTSSFDLRVETKIARLRTDPATAQMV